MWSEHLVVIVGFQVLVISKMCKIYTGCFQDIYKIPGGADFWTDVREISVGVFLNSNKNREKYFMLEHKPRV